MNFLKKMKKRDLAIVASIGIAIVVILLFRSLTSSTLDEDGGDYESDVEQVRNVISGDESDVELEDEFEEEQVVNISLEDEGEVAINQVVDSSSENGADTSAGLEVNLPPDFVVSVGSQEITTREVEMINRLHAGDSDADILLGMHMYIEITNMLLFQHATELGIAPTIEEARTFIDSELRQLVPASDFIEMGIPSDEYWTTIGLRPAQNLLMADNITQHLNDNDPTTQFPIEQYQNLVTLGRELMQTWMTENPELVAQFRLNEAAQIFEDFENN